MNKENKIILILLAIAITLFIIIQFIIIPNIKSKENKYIEDQTDSLTHDISNIQEFKTKYIGDSSNTCNLFYNLPLNNIPMKFQINPKICSLTVNYLDTIFDIGENKVKRDLIYNSTIAMALIDNLTSITYEFSGDSFTFNRTSIEKIFDQNLSNLLDKTTWKEQVQNKLNDTKFVELFY